ncbi:hypothetical protein BDN72DRAFT_866316, partial [Pluteus cervinus]
MPLRTLAVTCCDLLRLGLVTSVHALATCIRQPLLLTLMEPLLTLTPLRLSTARKLLLSLENESDIDDGLLGLLLELRQKVECIEGQPYLSPAKQAPLYSLLSIGSPVRHRGLKYPNDESTTCNFASVSDLFGVAFEDQVVVSGRMAPQVSPAQSRPGSPSLALSQPGFDFEGLLSNIESQEHLWLNHQDPEDPFVSPQFWKELAEQAAGPSTHPAFLDTETHSDLIHHLESFNFQNSPQVEATQLGSNVPQIEGLTPQADVQMASPHDSPEIPSHHDLPFGDFPQAGPSHLDALQEAQEAQETTTSGQNRSRTTQLAKSANGHRGGMASKGGTASKGA